MIEMVGGNGNVYSTVVIFFKKISDLGFSIL